MDENARYLLQLFYSQSERQHFDYAAALLKLLRPRLPEEQFMRLGSRLREKAIRQIVAERRIEYLVHFTRWSNLESIREHGLLPRRELETRSLSFEQNDSDRWDGYCDASCLSISFPNYQMFYKIRQTNPDVRWVVLFLKPTILWKKDCAFCVTNAASRVVSSLPLEDRKTVSALKRLFADYEDGEFTVLRSQLAIPDFFPTNPQAEVLVFDQIEPDNILDIDCDRLREHGYFGSRIDAAFWSNGKGIRTS